MDLMQLQRIADEWHPFFPAVKLRFKIHETIGPAVANLAALARIEVG